MKKTVMMAFILILATLALFAVEDVLSADFIGQKKDKVYQIVTKVGCHTTLEIPEGKKIKHFIIGDQKLWKAESDGKYAFIKPIQAAVETTISVITTDEKMFLFTAIEATALGRDQFHKKVKILAEDDQPMIKSINRPSAREAEGPDAEEIKKITERQFAESKLEFLKSLDSYRVKKNVFDVLGVYHDGIFTYIDLSNNQVRPAVFLANKQHKSKLEPVNYTDNNGVYTVHRVLSDKSEYFVLKNGPHHSIIHL